MTARLSRRASGARHLRWAREIRATISAHVAHNTHLPRGGEDALKREARSLNEPITALERAVTAYRGYLDGAHVENRAELRVANFLADEAQRATDGALRPHRDAIAVAIPGGLARVFSGLPLSRVLRAGHERTAQLARDASLTLRALPASVAVGSELADRLDEVASRLGELLAHRDSDIEPQRRPLKLAVERAVLDLREQLEQMDARLRAHLPPTFIESLYPELARGGTAVADEPDEDDDDTDDPSPTPVAGE